MAPSTRKSLAGSAASAARKVIGGARGAVRTEPEPAVVEVPPAAATSAPATKPARKPATKSATSPPGSAATTPARKRAAKAPATPTPAVTVSPTAKTTAKKTTAKTPAKTAAKTTVKTTARKKAAPVSESSPAKKTAEHQSATRPPAPKGRGARPRADALVVKEGEEAWTAAELAEVVQELHEQREHSGRIVEDLDSEISGLMRDSGDGAGQDQADVGASSFERDHELTVLSHERDKVAQIDRALDRIEDGTYGVCESCGEPIGKMRLMAFPRATLCMTCKQREERR